MTENPSRAALRAIADGDKCYYPASVFDALSARIAEDLDHEVMMLAGSIASMAVLAAPDLIVMTQTELADLCRRICRASKLPLLVDADHGFGNALNAMRTIQDLENAGVAGASIEDTELPRPFGGGGAMRLLSVEEGAGKMKAAVAGKTDPDFIVLGRTSAAQVNGADDAIARCRAYEAAGVDMLFLVGIRTVADLEKISAATRLPLMLGHPPEDAMDLDYLASQRVRVCLRAHITLPAMVQAVHDAMKALREGAPKEDYPPMADKAMMARVLRQEDYDRWITDYLD